MTKFIQVPPDSTGKKIRHNELTDIYLNSETNIPSLGTTVHGSVTGAQGIIKGRHLDADLTVEYFLYSVTGLFATNDVLSSAPAGGGTVYGTVASVFNNIQTATNVVVDANNPDHTLDIDIRGQASVKFAEGSPTMDAFNNLRVSANHILGGYEFSQDSQAGLFQDELLTGATATWTPGQPVTPLVTSSAAGSSAIRTTNRYHFYQPGMGQLAMLTCSMTAGVTGNRKRWGYFSELDGVFFEQEGTTINVVLRSSNLAQETRVPQSQWNGDSLDGSGLSGLTLDVTKANLYWIDFAWLGVGTVRFGIVAEDGTRWAAHTFRNPGLNSGAYMKSGSLPLRWENVNTGSPGVGSTFNQICGAVYSEGETDYVFWRYGDVEVALTTVTTDTYLLAMRPKLEISPGIPNRSGIYPDTIEVFVTGGNVKLMLLDDSVLSTPSWVAAASLVEYDVSGSVSTPGDVFKTYYLGSGTHSIDVSKVYETNDEGLHVLADGTDAYALTLVATKLDGTTVQVGVTINYRELN